MNVFRISNGIEVPEQLRRRMVKVTDSELERREKYQEKYLNASLDGRTVFVSRDWLLDPDEPESEQPVLLDASDEDPEPHWLNFARIAFGFVFGYVVGAVTVHLGWLP